MQYQAERFDAFVQRAEQAIRRLEDCLATHRQPQTPSALVVALAESRANLASVQAWQEEIARNRADLQARLR